MTAATTSTELPSYLQLPPAAVCAGCGRSALAECRDDMQQFNHYLCTLCTEAGATTTPRDVGTTAGQAIGCMFYAAQDLLIEMLEAFDHVTATGPEAVAALAETLAEVQETPIGSWPLLDEQHIDGLGRTMVRLWELVDRLGPETEPETEPDPPPRAFLTLVKEE
ncbi:MAG: hypothetical protein ABR608_13835 [Pseudonocardiaceae bacterium]